MKEETEKKEDSAEVIVVKSMHEQWIQHPMTNVLIEALELHKGKFVKSLVRDAVNSGITSDEVRYMAIGLRDIDAVLQLIKTPAILINYVS